MDTQITHIVVVGGGFAGINFIKSLPDQPNIQITLIDTNNYHFFPPLIYQVATAFIDASNISYPFRKMFQDRSNVRFHLGAFMQVNTEGNTVETANGVIPYDYIVFAHGTETNYFGMENVKQAALPMKTLADALSLKNHLLLNMEYAARQTDLVKRKEALNIVIAGGGPSGVEIAGMIAELGKHVFYKEFKEIKTLTGHIYLVDAAPALLGPMSKIAQDEAKAVLEKLGVNVILNMAVKDYEQGAVVLGDGTRIPTKTLIWTSGVTGRAIPGLPQDVIGRGRRVLVDAYNRVQGMENVFALGDICLQTADANYSGGHPQLAQVAMQQGDLLGKNLIRLIENVPLKAFSYNNKGSMAIIAKYKAVADLPSFSFKGFFAWMAWLVIHLVPIAGFRNKSKLLNNWFWSYLTNNPTLRMILKPNEEPDKK
ncbi:NAD(P)/FAD-dependent oxidoreductase [Sphingobacteriaceae bacterium WQ 2009]|uniref:NADH:ubiquinone reductase (non-electrogenic) n=1 Tax=Rhinopithecimicrobium faecis TaxID=2820698 RepID=A0A8T4HAM7_9SPHI|nr:NAD(P)/FAD-dependent oxidoreductase [Sphingobacteriaceae bacterium WQ 2009]